LSEAVVIRTAFEQVTPDVPHGMFVTIMLNAGDFSDLART